MFGIIEQRKWGRMITKKQKRVLEAIKDFININNYSPSVRELATILDLKSTSTVQGYLNRLQTKGYIAKNNDNARTLHILKMEV